MCAVANFSDMGSNHSFTPRCDRWTVYELCIEICFFVPDREELFRSLTFCVTQVYPALPSNVKVGTPPLGSCTRVLFSPMHFIHYGLKSPNRSKITSYWLASCLCSSLSRCGRSSTRCLRRDTKEIICAFSQMPHEIRSSPYISQFIRLLSMVSSGIIDYVALSGRGGIEDEKLLVIIDVSIVLFFDDFPKALTSFLFTF